MAEKFKILYIDDETDNLFGFKASFRMDYDVLLAESAAQAVQILEKSPDVRVVFCDQRMPTKTGTAFFEEMKQRFPLPVRILITAHTDIDVVITAINNGNIFRYIRKPWLDVDIISAIEEANKFYMTSSMLLVRNQELQEAYAELDKFAYTVSHDLRGPLSGILGAIDIAQELSDLKVIKELLQLMGKSIFKLHDYISGMHDYYRSRQGQLKVAEIDFNLLAEELKDVYRIYAKTDHIGFDVKVEQRGPFHSDELMIKMILNNLITNAIKYQKKDFDNKRIELNISVDKSGANIRVADTGIGIPESHFGEIFNLFSKVSAHGTGSGIGLYNVKDALIKLGGNIDVHSVLNEGTVFDLAIPNHK